KNDLLYGFELYEEKFNASLVVLASCESASGTARKGEGTFSLARSFINSGVPEILAAQFLIPQSTTAPLLSYFYQALSEGKDAALALHEAKLEYLENISNERYTYPRFWAGMVLYR
ncbi:MAG: CHAT domain-containing protein, partial [Bacteroidota bacterium]